jgi:anti-sigma regulatory factor (Ser/Thr protein kinase)
MPLGLMPEMAYEEKEASLARGDQVILYSDGLIEAHNPEGEMFGFPRLRGLLSQPTCSEEMIQCMLDELSAFTGQNWEQEDDVTFVSLEREGVPAGATGGSKQANDAGGQSPQESAGPHERKLVEFNVTSQPGNERQVMEQVANAVAPLGVTGERLERLKTAVAEATMNAMEHGNHYQLDLPVEIEVLVSDSRPAARDLVVRIRDHGASQIIPESEIPDIDAKLAGLQSPRGWGLFLIKNMVDEMRVASDEKQHTVELIMHLEERLT